MTVGVASGRRPAGARRRAGLVPGRGGGDGLGDGRPGRLVEGARRDVIPGEITSLSSRAMRFRLADVSTEALGGLCAASGRELTATYLPSTVVAYAAFAAPARGPGDSTRMPRWPRAR